MSCVWYFINWWSLNQTSSHSRYHIDSLNVCSNTTITWEVILNSLREFNSFHFPKFWTDEFLTWDPKKYGDIKLIKLWPHQVWLPDLFSTSPFDPHSQAHHKVRVQSNGDIFFKQKMIVTRYCWMNLANFPFDKTTCQMNFIFPAFRTDNLRLEDESK